MSKRTIFKKTYDFNCCKCGYKQWAAPSIMMTGFGLNQGHGSCLGCKTFLHLKIDGGLTGKKMVSILWDDFMKNMKKNKKEFQNGK